MPWVAAAIAAAAVVQSQSSKKAADAAGQAGQAQAAAAQSNVNAATQARQTAYNLASSAALPSPQELQIMGQTTSNSLAALNSQMQSIQAGQAAMANISPAIQQAGKNTYDLLAGQTSALLKPLQDQLAYQRGQLQQQLAQKYGSGYQTTAAGILALNNFDMQSGTTMMNAQFQAISQSTNSLSSLVGANNAISQNNLQTVAQNQNILTTEQQLQMQAANIYAGGTAGVLGAGNNLTSTIGNQFAGQIAQGQNMSSLFGNLGQSATTYGILNSLYGNNQSGGGTTQGFPYNPSAAPVGGYTPGSTVTPGTGPLAPQNMSMVLPTPGGGYSQTASGYSVGSGG